jgi:hypothetical protein
MLSSKPQRLVEVLPIEAQSACQAPAQGMMGRPFLVQAIAVKMTLSTQRAAKEMAAKRFQGAEKSADNFCGLAEQPRGA